jgi:hypothetical protein
MPANCFSDKLWLRLGNSGRRKFSENDSSKEEWDIFDRGVEAKIES